MLNNDLILARDIPKLKIPSNSVGGYTTKFLRAGLLDVNGTEVDMVEGGSFAELDSATLYLVSDNVLDTDIEYEVTGIDEDHNYVQKVVRLNGTTPVRVEGYWNHLSGIINVTGSAVSNINTSKASVGIVRLHNAGDTETFLSATARKQSGQSCSYVAPAGRSGFLSQIALAVNKGSGADTPVLFTIYYKNAGGVWYVAYETGAMTSGTTSIVIDLDPYILVPSLAEIRLTATAANQTADISTALNLYEVSNTELYPSLT